MLGQKTLRTRIHETSSLPQVCKALGRIGMDQIFKPRLDLETHGGTHWPSLHLSFLQNPGAIHLSRDELIRGFMGYRGDQGLLLQINYLELFRIKLELVNEQHR